MTDTRNVTIAIPARFLFKNVGGEPVYLDTSDLPDSVLPDILMGGINIILNNAFNGGGKEANEALRMSNVNKRWDSWKRGSYRITERGASQASLMKECYVADMMAKHDTTAKAVEQAMKATVKAVMGNDTNATFDNFLKATAITIAGRKGESRSADEIEALLVAKYEKAAAELEASRAKANDVDIDLTAIDI